MLQEEVDVMFNTGHFLENDIWMIPILFEAITDWKFRSACQENPRVNGLGFLQLWQKPE